MYVDMPENDLRQYASEQVDPADFDEFWATTLEEARRLDWAPELARVKTGLTTIDVFDLTFAGFNGERIRAWLRVPAGSSGPLPCVVSFVGYSGGRGRAEDNLFWASAGFAHLQMDSRGQGSTTSPGDTPDNHASGPQVAGFLTRGIDAKENYYYRRLLTDAARAVDAARSIALIDSDRVVVAGGSQGGGMALAVSALVPDVTAVIAYVPFLCDFPRAAVATDQFPYKEIGTYLAVHREKVAQVHHTLSYFDGVNFAKRANAPAFFSVALMDTICPPSSIFGAVNNYAGDKKLTVWPYNGHEAGGIDDSVLALSWLREQLASRAGLPTSARRFG
jgi:cephalosporin-C deacetylase